VVVVARATTYAIRSCRQPGVHCLPESSVGSPSSTPTPAGWLARSLARSLARDRSRRSLVSRAPRRRRATRDGPALSMGYCGWIGNRLGDIDRNQSIFRKHIMWERIGLLIFSLESTAPDVSIGTDLGQFNILLSCLIYKDSLCGRHIIILLFLE